MLLVFLSIILLGLEIDLSIIAVFIAVITHNPRKVFFGAFRPFVVGGYIISSSRSPRTGVSLLIFYSPFNNSF